MKDCQYHCYCQTNSVEESQNLGCAIGAYMIHSAQPLCVALIGDLGTGKTHISQGIGRGFGVKEEMTSPTFALMNTYRVGRHSLYHFDLYRLEELSELEGIGFYEYTDDQQSIVEWADKFQEELPDETLWIYIKRMDDTTRSITMMSDVLDDGILRQLGGSYVVGN